MARTKNEIRRLHRKRERKFKEGRLHPAAKEVPSEPKGETKPRVRRTTRKKAGEEK